MNAALGKLRTFGVLLILAVGLLIASATLVAADAGVPLYVDGHEHLENMCMVASAQADCSTCCHDMSSSVCCSHIVALGIEADAQPTAAHNVVIGRGIPVAMHGAPAEVGKRPPRYAA